MRSGQLGSDWGALLECPGQFADGVSPTPPSYTLDPRESARGALPGSSNQLAGNGAVNVKIADAAKAAGVPRLVYVSVASDLANGPAKFVLGDYFKGKAQAEAAVKADYAADASLILKPAIIEGGPPGEIRPPGPPGVAPVKVEALAKAAVAGALGKKSGVLDGTAAINGA